MAQPPIRGSRRTRVRAGRLLALGAVFVLLGGAERPAAAQLAEPWRTDDILLARSIGELALGPDARRLVWVRSGMDADTGERVAHLLMHDLDAGTEVRLTRGRHRDASPRWSPDGRHIAFLSDRPLPEPKKKDEAAGTQLWLLDAAGGEPWPVAALPRAVRDFAWIHADTILFAAAVPPSLHERDVRRREDTSVVVEDTLHEAPVRLWRLAVGSAVVAPLTRNDDWIRSLAVSPDGRRAVTVHDRSLSWTFDQRVPPVTMLTDLHTGEARQLFDGTRVIPGDVRWTPDGSGFYFVNDSTTHPVYRTATLPLLHHYEVATGRTTLVTRDWPRGFGGDYAVTADGVLALLADGVYMRLARYRRDGAGFVREPVPATHDGHIWGFELGDDGRTLVYEHSRADLPPQLWRATLEDGRLSAAERIAEPNAALAAKPMPRVEVLRWPGAGGEEVEGLLYYPLDWQEGRRYPLALSIHGGPTGTDTHSWSMGTSTPIALINQEGVFVLKANYHGSAGYGIDWVESICCGRYYDLEIPDLEAGVDHVVALGLADPDRIATTGWSNGAILSTELTTRNPGRYRAAVVGAGDVEWFSDWSNVDFGASFDNYYFGATPWEDPQLYLRKSPVFRFDAVRTPTLIFHGTEDRAVPTDQSWTHYRVLQQLGNVPVRLVLFPGEPHGLRKLEHQRRKVSEELAWLRRYLLGHAPPDVDAVQPGSPLEALLAAGGAATVDGQWGRLAAGRLVPETVRFAGLEIGRFEVTRAQLAAFDPSYDVAPETADLPATGLTWERARAYVRWLAEVTGEPWRLPTAAEARALRDRAGEGDTLDRWAGYAPNPDDADRLRRLAQAVRPGALLLPVAATATTAEAPERGGSVLFGLNGNAAEWATGDDGSGVLVGGSADRTAAETAAGEEAGPEYRGLRVVRGR